MNVRLSDSPSWLPFVHSAVTSLATVTITTLATALGAVCSTAAESSLVVPTAYATADGRNGSSVLRSVIRLQDAYDASLFPNHPVLIRELRYRPSTVAMGALTSTIPDLQINLSTTVRPPEELSWTLAENVGLDDTVVFRGGLDVASANSGPPNGPKDFDLIVPLASPFWYDPAKGNLLVDIRNFSGSTVTWVDVAGGGGDKAGRAFALSADATSAQTVDVGVDVLQVVYDIPPSQPSITKQPQSQTAMVGATVTFSVTAGGTPPLSFQWLFNETPIEGATHSSLVLANLQTAQEGNYAVVVTNLFGAAVSSNAVLTVKAGVVGTTVVVPKAFEMVDGGNGSSLLRSVIRLQDVYGAALLPTHPILIHELRLRPSAVYGGPFNTTIEDIQINISTTPAQPENLSHVFADNVGTDDTMVFRGTLSLSSAFSGASGGPKDFDMVIPLATPFTYDPAAGNLLIDYRNFSGSSVTYVDAGGSANDLASRAFSLDPNGASATTVDSGAELLQIVYSETSAPPRIISQPRSQTVLDGATVVFSVSVSGTPPLTYQWQHDGTPIADATNATFTFDSAQPEQQGAYAVVVANAQGSTTSSNAVLTVVSDLDAGEVVVPNAYEQVDGGNGSGLLNNGIRLQQVYGSSLFPQKPLLIREIRFRPSTGFGQAFTATIADLQIKLSTTSADPEHLSSVFADNHGPDKTVVFSGAVTLSSSFSGPAGGPKAFDMVIPLTTPFLYDPSGGNLLIDYRNSSGSAATFVDAGGSATDQGSRAFALGANSTTATTVDQGAEVIQLVYSSEPAAPSLVTQPQSLTASLNESASFSVLAIGAAPLSYQWLFNGGPLPDATNASLTLSDLRAEHAGEYSVVVSNNLGTVSSLAAHLTILTNIPGTAVIVPAAFAQADANNGSGVLNTAIRLQEVYGASLFPQKPITIRELRFRPSAVYGRAFTATIPDIQINISTTAARPENLDTIFARNIGSDDTMVFRGPLAMSSSFSGPVAGPKAFDMIIPLTTPFVYDPIAGNLLIEFRNYEGSVVTFVDAGASQGDQASRAFAIGANATHATTLDGGADVLQVVWSDEPLPPSVVSQPADVIVAAGSSAMFTVVAGGTPPLSYQWLFNENEITGETNATLEIANVQPANAGGYAVRVANDVGSVVSSPATLTLESGDVPASITTISPWQTVSVGEAVTLVVEARGTAPLSYQWFFNGELITTATSNSLILANVEVSQAGTYSVTVSNAFGPLATRDTVLNVRSSNGGTVAFTSVLNTNWSYIYDEDGVTKLEGSDYLVQLYAGPAPEELAPVGAAVPFLTGPAAGLFNGGNRNIPTVAPGAVANVQVRSWEAALGTTFEDARDAGGKIGWSAILQIVTGGSGIPPSVPARLTGLQSFSIQHSAPPPAPVVMAESLVTPPSLGAGYWEDDSGETPGALRLKANGSQGRQFRFKFNGVAGADYVVEVSTNLVDWTPLVNLLSTSGSAIVTDPDAGRDAHRFYRARLLR